LQLRKAALTHAQTYLLLSVEATWVCIPIGNIETFLATVYKSPKRLWSDTDITEIPGFRNNSIPVGDMESTLFGIVKFQTPQA
jgi:hypothetical protein